MKKIVLSLVSIFIAISTFAQIDGISYQAVIVDNNADEIPGVDIASNNLPNAALKVRFTINGASGIEYQEVHETMTDDYGMINLMIGRGDTTGDSPSGFYQIYWDGNKNLKVEIDFDNGDGFVLFSNQQLTYIPYVRHREIIATSTLDVDGVTNLNNDLIVDGATNLNSTLEVEDATNLNNSLEVDGDTDLNSDLTVHNQSPTYLTGDLTVDGIVAFDGELEVGGDTQLYADLTVDGTTNLNGVLNVNNGEATNLSGNLTVQGTSDFQDGNFQNISVSQTSDLNGNLEVAGTTSLNDDLTVNAASTLNDNLTVNATSNFNNRVVINANVNGGQGSSASYPLEVKGSNQGIWIDVDGGRNSSKNFITFSDGSGNHGAIEGQTLSELQGSFRYIWDAAQALAEEAFVVAEGIACGFQLDLGEAGVMAVEGLNAYAQLIELVVNAENNVGVSFKTGGADYAEWLPKKDQNEKFYTGEIVGVVGGYISKDTKNADHIMVISTNPIVLGNTPDKKDEYLYEKVAFLGQVPVRVLGKVNIGDYILPSGIMDGIGIAKSPSEMSVHDYKSILGVAWEASSTSVANVVNVAIGINTNDISTKVAQNEQEINSLKKQLATIMKQLNGESIDEVEVEEVTETNLVVNTSQVTTSSPLLNGLRNRKESTVFKPQDFDKFIADYGKLLEERMAPLKAHFDNAGVDLSKFPEVQNLIENPIQMLKDMQSGKYLPSLWESLEKRYPKAFKYKN